jgi:hypothetical protein
MMPLNNQAQTAHKAAKSNSFDVAGDESPVAHFWSSVACPLPAPCWLDQRLRNFDISFWSEIDVTNSFALEVILNYLKTDYPLMGLIDVDLFLDDFVGRRTAFCSKFLVHALMAIACVCLDFFPGD